MPRKGTRRPESSTGRPRPNRPKLDARLQFLLSLPADRLATLVQGEGRRLQEVTREIGAARAAVDTEKSGSGKSRAGERLRAAEGRAFAPLSTGFHVPVDPKRAAPPARRKEPFISAFILSDASAADLADLGARVRTRAGDVFTAFIPLSAIPRLEASAAVRYIELERPMFPALQSALLATQIGQLHNPPVGLPAHTGAGVIVGVVDLEILDIYHPAFRTEADATRILYLWDQRLSAPADGPAPTSPVLLCPYGVEYDRATIDTELSPGHPVYSIVKHAAIPNNVASHGTFVTGIAAGNGRQPGQPPTNVGAAPAADIIYVRARLPEPTELFVGATHIADAFAYIFDKAGQLGQPCVVNMSAGDDQGPHDGSTLGERFIDELLLTPGRALTVSAGNANNTESHAFGAVGQGLTVDLKLTYANGATSSDIIEIWYDGHDRFTVTVTPPNGAAISNVTPGTSTTQTLGGVTVTVTSILDSPLNHDNVIGVILAVDGQPITPGDWTFALTGTQVINGAFHAWVDRNNRNQSAWKLPLNPGDPGRQEGRFTLSVPATARRVITVGNHAEPPPLPGPQTPVIDSISGRGPTRDGRIKPEIASVGTGITAPRSRDMRLMNPGSFYMTKVPATSWSAPLVAGTCALLFECRGPSATWANLKQILTDLAGTTGLATLPGDDFGFGYLQAGLACTGAVPVVDAWLRDDVTDTGLEPFTGPVAWLSPDIEVLDTAGNLVANPTHHPTNRFNNIIRVTVRNRGAQPARNTEVSLYWADPATNIPYSAWRAEHIFTGSPNFATQGNTEVIPVLAPGASTQVQFAWAPPAPGSNFLADDHFCLVARVENEGDPAQVGLGGWSVITARNNIALRNVHVQPAPSTMGFWVVGSADPDSLIIRPQDAEIELLIPIEALPWRDRRFIERHGVRTPYGWRRTDDPLRTVKTALKGDDIGERTDVFGATTFELHDGVARIRATAERGLVLKSLRLLDGARLPVRLNVKARTEAGPRFVHVAQYSGGQLVGGVSLQFGRTRYAAGRDA